MIYSNRLMEPPPMIHSNLRAQGHEAQGTSKSNNDPNPKSKTFLGKWGEGEG
jgi:hypothetical protein